MSEEQRFVVLTTSQVMGPWKQHEEQPLLGTFADDYPVYSTGVLEHALKEGYIVVMVSSRLVLTPSIDVWWMNLVAGSSDKTIFGIRLGSAEVSELTSWKVLFDTVGVAMPDTPDLDKGLRATALKEALLAAGVSFKFDLPEPE